MLHAPGEIDTGPFQMERLIGGGNFQYRVDQEDCGPHDSHGQQHGNAKANGQTQESPESVQQQCVEIAMGKYSYIFPCHLPQVAAAAIPTVCRDPCRALALPRCLAIGIVRAGVFLVYALLEIPAPDQPFHLEGASVLFRLVRAAWPAALSRRRRAFVYGQLHGAMLLLDRRRDRPAARRRHPDAPRHRPGGHVPLRAWPGRHRRRVSAPPLRTLGRRWRGLSSGSERGR